MTFAFIVEKVANTRHPAFVPDPNDELNTMDSGKWIQEVTFERVPDETRGGLGTLTLQLNDADQIGKFEPGKVVRVDIEVQF